MLCDVLLILGAGVSTAGMIYFFRCYLEAEERLSAAMKVIRYYNLAVANGRDKPFLRLDDDEA